jgi:hypothetical protein
MEKQSRETTTSYNDQAYDIRSDFGFDGPCAQKQREIVVDVLTIEAQSIQTHNHVFRPTRALVVRSTFRLEFCPGMTPTFENTRL